MRNTRPIVILCALTLLVTACGNRAGSAAAQAPTAASTTMATTTMPPATTTDIPPANGTEPNAVPIPPSTTTPPSPTTTTTTTTLPPVFAYTVGPVTAETVWASWREDCPLHYDDLSLLTLSYWNFDREAVTGSLVINTSVVDDVVAAFRGLFEIGFPIQELALVDKYDGDDKAAMRANVTSGFNCRFVDGTDRWSNHAFGLAIDINPLINPWAREGNVLPLEGTQYANRESVQPGMINVGDEAISIFAELGWSWGGVWQSADYMHFSQPGN